MGLQKLPSLAKVPRAGRGRPASPQSACYHTRLQPTALSCFRFLKSRVGQLTRPSPLAGLAELRWRPKAAGARLLRSSSGGGGVGAEDGAWLGRPRGWAEAWGRGHAAQEARPGWGRGHGVRLLGWRPGTHWIWAKCPSRCWESPRP